MSSDTESAAAETATDHPERTGHPERTAARVLRIGVLGPFTSNPEAARQLTGVLRSPSAAAHEILVFDEASGAEAPVATVPEESELDGLIILSVPLCPDVVQRLCDDAIPAIMVDLEHDRLSSVVTDHRGGGYAAGVYLSERGHDQIAYVGHRQDHDYDSQSRQKLDGLTRAVSTAPQVYNTDLTLRSGLEAGRRMFAEKDPPTAVLTHTDALAAGVLTAAREAGLDVPGDVAIVGFNNTDIAELLDITTLAQPFEQAGQTAMQLLTEHLYGGVAERRTITLQPRLIERSTT